MAASNCQSFNAHDGFRQEHLLHLPDTETSPALKIVLGTLLGALLALAGILSGPPQSVDRFALPEELNALQATERPLGGERLVLPSEAPPPVVIEGR